MAVHLVHIVDQDTPEEAARLLSLLLEYIPAERLRQEVIVLGRPPVALAVPAGLNCARAGRRLGCPWSAAHDLRSRLAARSPDAIHAWGTPALSAAGWAGISDTPLLVTICQPHEIQPFCRDWCDLFGSAGAGNVICTSKKIQSLLVNSGIPAGTTMVIPPGTDLEAIRQAKAATSRAELGLPTAGRVLLTAAPPSRAGGQYYAVWVAAVLGKIWPDLRLIIPGCSKEQQRLRRLIETTYCPEIYHLTENRHTPEQLLAVSDLLLFPAVSDVNTGWLSAAMAAELPIVATTVPAVREIITDEGNGFLCAPADPHALAVRIRDVFENPKLARQCAAAAYRQAEAAERGRDGADAYLRAVESLLAAIP